MKFRFAMCVLLLAPPAAAEPQTLSMEQAVEIALRQQPALRQSRAQVEASLGRVAQIEATKRPTLSLSTSASIGASGTALNDLTYPTAGFGASASAAVKITDFGQTAAQLRAARLSSEASRAGVQTSINDLRSQVEVTYLEAVARARLVTVAEATVQSEVAHVDQAKRFVAAQAKDPIEVVQAQSRFANARASLAQAQSNAAIALANLRAAIGWVDPSATIAISTAWPDAPTESPPSLVDLVTIARKSRPELVQLDKQVAASEASIEAARAVRRPTLSATGRADFLPNYAFRDAALPGFDRYSNRTSWSLGVTLTWQAFDGGRAAADVRVARANRESALAQRDALLLDMTSQLDSARAQIDANRAATQASTEAVESARAQLKLAEARYAQGLGSQIELADAQTAVTTAEGNLIQSEFQLGQAWATLRRSLGVFSK